MDANSRPQLISRSTACPGGMAVGGQPDVRFRGETNFN
jgi:hypothetical protein